MGKSLFKLMSPKVLTESCPTTHFNTSYLNGVAAIHHTVVWHKLKPPRGPPHRQPFNLPGLASVNLPLSPVQIIPMDSMSFNYDLFIVFQGVIEMGLETVKKNGDQYLLRRRQKQKICFHTIYYCCWKTILSCLIKNLIYIH